MNEYSNDIRLALQQAEITFSRNEAAKIVGGLTRLLSLVDSGRIRATKRSSSQNGRWRCNAADVLLHARPRRAKSYWERHGTTLPRGNATHSDASRVE